MHRATVADGDCIQDAKASVSGTTRSVVPPDYGLASSAMGSRAAGTESKQQQVRMFRSIFRVGTCLHESRGVCWIPVFFVRECTWGHGRAAKCMKAARSERRVMDEMRTYVCDSALR
jgi:hypothetical protein